MTLLTATLIHSDKFRWDYAPTWGWTVVYGTLPVAAIYLWMHQGRVARDVPPEVRDPRLGILPTVSLGLGLVLLAIAAILFVAPAGLLDDWPWALTPLMARVFAGWYLLAAVTLLFLGASMRRGHELVIPFATAASWSLFVLLLPVTHSDTVDTGAPLFAPFLAIHALTLGACAVIATRGLVLARRDGQHL